MTGTDGQRKAGVGALLALVGDLLKIGLALFKFLGVVFDFFGRLAGTVVPPSTVSPAPEAPQRVPQSGRGEDREIESISEVNHRESFGTLLVAVSFLIGILGGAGFVISYWTGSNSTLKLGLSLALFMGGMGVTLVVWARWLMLEKEAVEPRHPLGPIVTEEQDAAQAFCIGSRDIRRRRLLKWMGLGATGVFGAMVVSLLRSLGPSPYAELDTTVWKGGQRLVAADGNIVSLSSLQPGSSMMVFPEDQVGAERAQTVLIRVNEDRLRLPKDRSTWAPSGYLAYSRVCTHAGCPVGEFESKQSLLLCPCHQSTFDVLRAAIPTGGPAARALPQLPLYADTDGTLRAGGGFTAPPGPGYWGIS